MAIVIVGVVAGWGRRFASSKLLVVKFAFVFAFVLASFQSIKPGGKTKPPDENATWMMKNTTCRRKEITGGKAET